MLQNSRLRRGALFSIAALLPVLLTSTTARAEATRAEQVGPWGVNTFTNYHNASGTGPRIDPGSWAQISCKVYDPFIVSANPDGYWYRIASQPWSDAYYSPANTFMNGDPWNGPYTRPTDWNVPDCGAAAPPPVQPEPQPEPQPQPEPGPTPAASPKVSLSQGPAAPLGFRYAITLDNFPASAVVSVACFASWAPSGFYTFNVTTDGSGHVSTADWCYTADGPDHWVIAAGVESNHLAWSTTPPEDGGQQVVAPPVDPGDTSGVSIPPVTTPGPDPAARLRSYIALGDSYSSGEGSPPFDPDSDRPGDACHRSRAAWPRVVSRSNASGMHLIALIACSGAKSSALTSRFNKESPQLEQLKSAPTADVITITLGGNDIGFSSVLKDCYVYDCIRSADIDLTTDRLANKRGYPATLTAAFKAVKVAAKGARVIVVGYPNIFPRTQAESIHCGWLSDRERPALVNLASTMDAVSLRAARDAGVEFVSTLHTLAGHELCTRQSWLVSIGLGTGAQLQQNGHPMAQGQVAIAGAVIKYVAH